MLCSHEWFQTEHSVSVGILAKNLKQEDTVIDIKTDSVRYRYTQS